MQRTECQPRFATPRSPGRETLGRAAARVAKVLGKRLMPWQRAALDVALEVDDAGRLVYGDVTQTTPRQQGKSYELLVLMVTRGLLTGRQGIAYASQTALDSRKKLLDDWGPLVAGSPLGPQVKTYMAPGRESMTLGNGSQIAIVASTVKAGHGRVIDLAVLDEAFSYPDGRTEQALRPAQMTRTDAQLWVVSTAGTPDQSPYLLDKVTNGRLAVEAGVAEGLCFIEYSAPDDADPADPETWRACMPALGFTVTEDAVRKAFQSMPRHEFERAYLNRWTSAIGDPVIDLDVWQALADPQSPRPASIVLGVDVSPRSKSASIAAAGRIDDRLHVALLECGPGTDWVAGRLAVLRERYGCEAICDPKACAPILPALEELDVTTIDTDDLPTGCAFLVDLVARGKLRHRGERELLVAIDGAAQRPLGDQWAWSRKNSGVDISPLVAVTLACWGWWGSWGDS